MNSNQKQPLRFGYRIAHALVVICMAFAMPVTVLCQDKTPEPEQQENVLPRAIKKRMDDSILPALFNNQRQRFVTELAETINRLDQVKIDLLEEYAAKQGFKNLKAVFAQSLIEAVESGAGDFSQLDPRFELSVYLGMGIRDHIEKSLKPFDKFLVKPDKLELPEEWRSRELTFWQLHVFNNEMINFKRLAKFATNVVAKHQRIAERNQLDEKLKLLEPITKLPKQIEKTAFRFYENTAVLHYMQLKDAAATLETETDFLTRLYAAYALQDDAAWLKKFLTDVDVAKLRDQRLKDSQALEFVKVWYDKGARHGKSDDVLQKSVLLRVGVHWWLRGRYGRAHLNNGQLKLPIAMDSPVFMFSMFMPKERPKPVCSYLGPEATSEGYDRRHFYSWNIEKLAPEFKSETTVSRKTSSKNTAQTGKVKGHSFW